MAATFQSQHPLNYTSDDGPTLASSRRMVVKARRTVKKTRCLDKTLGANEWSL